MNPAPHASPLSPTPTTRTSAHPTSGTPAGPAPAPAPASAHAAHSARAAVPPSPEPTSSPAYSLGSLSVLASPPTTQAAAATQAIKNYIIAEHLQPGQPLPTESRLCADLGMSRSSVREAMRTLVALDIVEVRHGHGTFVGQSSMRPMVESLVFRGLMNQGEDYRGLREVVEVRVTLDRAMAEAVIHAWQDRSDQEIDELVSQMETLAGQGHTFTQEDRLFHARLLQAVPNQLYRHLVEAFWAAHTITVPLLGAPHPADIIDTARAHRTMLDAARRGDAEAYRQAVDEHYAPLLRALGAN